MDEIKTIEELLIIFRKKVVGRCKLSKKERLEVWNIIYDLSALKMLECVLNGESKFSGTAENAANLASKHIAELAGTANSGNVVIKFDLGLDDDDGDDEPES